MWLDHVQLVVELGFHSVHREWDLPVVVEEAFLDPPLLEAMAGIQSCSLTSILFFQNANLNANLSGMFQVRPMRFGSFLGALCGLSTWSILSAIFTRRPVIVA